MNDFLASHPNETYLAIICVMAIAFIISLIWRAYQKSRPNKESSSGGSLIISMIGLNSSLSNLKSGTISGYKYNILMSGPRAGISLSGRVIVSIDLPFASPAHIAGFGLQDKAFQQALDNTDLDNSMVKVELEGDFPDYFCLYCQPSRELELREVLVPSAMQFLVDYCKRMQWEIVDSNLYFAQSDKAGGDTDQETAFTDAQSFIAKILPALQKL